MDHKIELDAAADIAGGKDVVLCDVGLHASEKRLIEFIRSLKNGEINSIKIQNGLPVFYVINLKDRRFL